MSASAPGLPVLAAFLHAVWNTLVKESRDERPFTWPALTVFRLAPVSYAGSVREMSVVVAVLLGWKRLGEPSGLRRRAAGLIFTGIALVSWT